MVEAGAEKLDEFADDAPGAQRRLQQSTTCQRGGLGTANDQVIEQPDIDQLEGRLQAPGDAFVGLAGFGNAGRMIVGKDNSGGIDRQRLLYNLARIDTGAVDRAAKQFIEAQHPMPVVEIQAAEHFVPEVANLRVQEGLRVRGALNCGADRQRLCEVTSCKLRQGAKQLASHAADALFGRERSRVGMQQLAQATKAQQQSIGEAGIAEHAGQKFGVTHVAHCADGRCRGNAPIRPR
jgi:hypothetical protein